MANKKIDNTGMSERALQPIVRPVTMVPTNGEQAGLQPVVRPSAPTGNVPAGGSGGTDKKT